MQILLIKALKSPCTIKKCSFINKNFDKCDSYFTEKIYLPKRTLFHFQMCIAYF